jgi:hypothetical protein
MKTSSRVRRSATLVLVMPLLLAGSASPTGAAANALARRSTWAGLNRTPAPLDLAVPDPLTDGGLDLRSGPVPVPLELRMPSLDAHASVVGVGITAQNVMDAPMGPADAPAWQQAFWYRGSAIPGASSTALLAGHVDDPLGRPGAFATIDRLRPGDLLVVHDTRNGLDVNFSVTGSMTYSLAQAADPAVLAQIYGAGPVGGTPPVPSADGLSHLNLITCAGTFRNGTHDHRLVVSAVRVAG